MFHVKHRRTRLLAAPLALMLALFLVACGGAAKPAGWAAPVAGDGDLIVVHDEHGRLSGVRVTEAGSTAVWTFPGNDDDHDYKAFYATPVIDRSGEQARVLAASYTGRVVSLDLATGALTPGWPAEVNVHGHVVATPVLDGSTLYVANAHGEVRSVDTSTGIVSQPLFKASDRIWGGLAFSDGLLYVGSLDGKLTAIAADGAERWTQDVGGAIAGDIAIDNGTVYAGTLESRVVALDAATGAESWSFKGDNWFWARPLITTDTVYMPTTLGTVYALARATGQERWHSRPGEAEMHTSPVLVEGALVVADIDGGIYGLDPGNGNVLWRQQQSGEQFFADPLVLESAIFYSSKDGTLVRVRPQDQGAVSVVYQRG